MSSFLRCILNILENLLYTECPNKHGNLVITFISIYAAFFHEHNYSSIRIQFNHTEKKGIYIYRPLYEKLVRNTASFYLLSLPSLHIRNRRRLSSRLSIPMFIGTLCILLKSRYFFLERSAPTLSYRRLYSS